MPDCSNLYYIPDYTYFGEKMTEVNSKQNELVLLIDSSYNKVLDKKRLSFDKAARLYHVLKYDIDGLMTSFKQVFNLTKFDCTLSLEREALIVTYTQDVTPSDPSSTVEGFMYGLIGDHNKNKLVRLEYHGVPNTEYLHDQLLHHICNEHLTTTLHFNRYLNKTDDLFKSVELPVSIPHFYLYVAPLLCVLNKYTDKWEECIEAPFTYTVSDNVRYLNLYHCEKHEDPWLHRLYYTLFHPHSFEYETTLTDSEYTIGHGYYPVDSIHLERVIPIDKLDSYPKSYRLDEKLRTKTIGIDIHSGLDYKDNFMLYTVFAYYSICNRVHYRNYREIVKLMDKLYNDYQTIEDLF